jgi:RNA polymerase sigma-70 factor (ECF subfamily)
MSASLNPANSELLVVTAEPNIDSAQGGGDPAWLLDGCRQYLLMIANDVIGPDLQAKLGPSDLVQDTLLEAQRHVGMFRGKSRAELFAWLRTILKCRLSNIRRSYLATDKRAAGRELTLEAFHDESSEGAVTLKSRTPSPSNHAMRSEWAAALEEALARLPEHYGQAVVLRHMEQLSWDEIGVKMNCTADAARKTWSRAIDQLRCELGSHGPLA